MLGASQPVTLNVTFNKMAPNRRGVMVTGFSARGEMKRSDFGMNYGQGGIGDVLDLYIEVEGRQK